MSAVEVIGLAKNYGRIQALKGVSLEVEQKQIFGLLGPNGAGKTTLVKILLNMVRATAGSAKILGLPSRKSAARREVGFLPEGHDFPGYHTGGSVLDFYGTLQGMSLGDRRRRIDEALDTVEMLKWKKVKIRKFSKGMKQRLGIAHAILHDPKVLFLDEPTDGIDPKGRRKIRDFLFRLKEEGKTIFLNSHLLGDVERMCDRVAILNEGLLIREGTVEELTRSQNFFTFRIAGDAPEFIDEMQKTFPTAALEPRAADGMHLKIALGSEGELDSVIDWLRGRRIPIRGLEKGMSLEDVFIELVEDKKPS